LCGRDRHDLLSFAVPYIRVLAPVQSIAGNLPHNRLRKVKGVVNNQIKGRPFTDFASPLRCYYWCNEVLIVHLTHEVDGRASIKTAEVIKQACKPPVFREGTTPRSDVLAVRTNFVFA